jgi:hypothetical protein
MRIFFLLLILASSATAADLTKIERKIAKEPTYKTTPSYALLVFGPEAKDKVWLVRDGDTLHVDKNANGDLTDAGEAVAKNPPRKGSEDSLGATFDVGDLSLGGKMHKGLIVYANPLSTYADGSASKRPAIAAALKKDPKDFVYSLRCDVEVPGIKGGGLDGRLSFAAGWLDLGGPLMFAEKVGQAPIIHLGGPLEVTFYGERATLRVGRGGELMLVVGSPGLGAGTLAMLNYDDTIPKTAFPKAEITFSAKEPSDKPMKELFELKERC